MQYFLQYCSTFAVLFQYLQYFFRTCSTFFVLAVLLQYHDFWEILQYLQYFFSTCSTFAVLFSYLQYFFRTCSTFSVLAVLCSICSIFSYAVPGPPLVFNIGATYKTLRPNNVRRLHICIFFYNTQYNLMISFIQNTGNSVF